MTGRLARLRALGRAHRGILLIALAALFPIFSNLGAGTLWSDEADTAVFAQSILRRGLPTAWDGVTFTESDRGRRLTESLVMVGTPWVPYYLTAVSLAGLGATSLAARLPFALAGLATLILLYWLVLRSSGDRLAALLSSALLLSSAQFLIYARQARHYSLNMLLSVALLLALPRLERRRIDLVFVAIAILLYHTHPLPAVVTLGVLGGLTLLHPAFRAFRRGFWCSIPIVVVLTAPWALLAWRGWDENSRFLLEPADLVPRLQQYVYEASVALPYVGWLALAPLAARRLSARDRAFLVLALALVGAYVVAMSIAQSTLHLWEYGLRYTSALLPIGAAVTGLLIARATAGARPIAVAITALFAFTQLPWNLALWMLVPPRGAPAERPAQPEAALHTPVRWVDKLFRTDLLGVAHELVEWSPGTDSRIVEFLKKNAQPGDIVVTNYAWEPLYFHTGLPQGYKVLADYPIYAAARAAGLPGYTFGLEETRWLIWRAPWEDYQGYRWAEVAARLRETGATLTEVARFRETTWENRENVHFRRFPSLGYLYPIDVDLAARPAQVYRVDHDRGSGGVGGPPASGGLRDRPNTTIGR